jgi:hypothetical protein
MIDIQSFARLRYTHLMFLKLNIKVPVRIKLHDMSSLTNLIEYNLMLWQAGLSLVVHSCLM